MDRKIFVNYIYNFLYQVIKIVVPFFLVPYTMGHLGESVLGISDFAINIASWFIIFGILGIREIGKVRDDRDHLSRTFFEIWSVQVINMCVVLILYVLYTHFLVQENKIIYYLYCCLIVSSAIDISWFYSGIENFRIVSLRNTGVKLCGVILIFLLVKTPADLWKFVLINTGTDLIGQALT